MIFKHKKIYLLFILFGISLLFLYMIKKTQTNFKKFEPIITIEKNYGIIEADIEGINLDVDNITLMAHNKLYMANIRFIEQFKQEITEMDANYDEMNDSITVTLTVDKDDGGTVQGPIIIFTMDCKNYQIVKVESIKYNEKEVLLQEQEMFSLGKVSLELIKMCNNMKSLGDIL